MPRKIRNILLLYLFLLVLYLLLRIVFFGLYYQGMPPVTQPDGAVSPEAGLEAGASGASPDGAMLYQVFYWGMRLDFSALIYLHLPFLVYYFFIHDLLRPRAAGRVAVALLLVLNLPFLAINCLDLVYFRFTLRRSTADLLAVWRDSLQAAGAFWELYWPFVLGFLMAAALSAWVFHRLFGWRSAGNGGCRFQSPGMTMRWWRANAVMFLLVAVPGVVLARGWAVTPLMPYTPLLDVAPRYLPLATNSTVTFLYSLARRQSQLQEKDYPDLPAGYRQPLRHQLEQAGPFTPRNVVVFVLESFCREYLEDGSEYRARTPFLDSLISRSTWYSEAYANGLISNQGLVAALGGLPPFTEEPYYYSVYSSNRIRGIGTLLKEKGYSTHFFMGAAPDHYGFGKLCHILGIDHYHSGADYPDNRFHDGVWGIYDHKFLPFAAAELDRQQGPFFAVLFNLSSHFPFRLPPGTGERFARMPGPPYKKVAAYVDYSLSQFFSHARHSSWYHNTVFYFIADHSVLNVVGNEVSRSALYNIPFFVFDPSEPVGRRESGTVQQLDLVPTILDELRYPDPFLSFGRSLHRPGSGCLITRYDDEIYLFRADSLELHYNGRLETPLYLYDHRSGNPARNRLGEEGYTQALETLVNRCRGFLQQYHEALIRNRLYVE